MFIFFHFLSCSFLFLFLFFFCFFFFFFFFLSGTQQSDFLEPQFRCDFSQHFSNKQNAIFQPVSGSTPWRPLFLFSSFFFLLFLFLFLFLCLSLSLSLLSFLFLGAEDLMFLASIASRFPFTFENQKFLSRLGSTPLEASFPLFFVVFFKSFSFLIFPIFCFLKKVFLLLFFFFVYAASSNCIRV